MPRIFAALAISELLLLTGAAAIGLSAWSPHPDRHILATVLSLILSCFIQAIVFTYLTVTGKLIGQAVHLGRLDHAPLLEVKQLKRRQSRWLALVVIGIVLAAATGGDIWRLGGSSTLHLAAAAVLLVVHGYVFVHQYNLICENGALVDRTLRSYQSTGGKPRGDEASLGPTVRRAEDLATPEQTS